MGEPLGHDVRRLGDFLRHQRGQILARWETEVRRLRPAEFLSRPVLLDHMPEFLDELARFVSDARSNAGAEGLMQVMPRTARFVAHKIGLRNYLHKGVTEVETNVTLGTGYLRLVLDQLGHPVLASAAYNAGPSRARRWRDVNRPLEGAIYIETIPFSETRDYVKKVMANSVFYAAMIEKQVTPLKARLGTIAPRGAAEPLDDDLLP